MKWSRGDDLRMMQDMQKRVQHDEATREDRMETKIVKINDFEHLQQVNKEYYNVGMKIIARKDIGGKTYLLTHGYGSCDFEMAKGMHDFAVYYDESHFGEDYIRNCGHKLSAEKAAEMFTEYGIKVKEFRR